MAEREAPAGEERLDAAPLGVERLDAVPPSEEQLEAELTLARLEDRIGAFTSYTLAADLLELREIYAGAFERVRPEDWGKRSDRRRDGWTRRETLAHVAAVTRAYLQSIEAGLAGRPVTIPGFERRADLRAVNQAVIAASAAASTAELVDDCLGALDAAARLAATLERESLGKLVPVPYFGAPPTVAELFGSALAHAGIVHGAQLALTRARPVWIYFQPGLMRRQITRFIHMFGLAYWPERGGDLHATLGFDIAGQGGGSWIVRVSPGGGHGKIGVARTTDVRCASASADLFCQLMTFQTPVWRALVTRQLRVSGNLALARRLPAMFVPTERQGR